MYNRERMNGMVCLVHFDANDQKMGLALVTFDGFFLKKIK